MLYRLFAKEAFEPIEKELQNIYKTLGIQDIKIKSQPATYYKAYTYVIEGQLKKHRFILSMHHSPLRESPAKKQLEFLIQCKNPNWVALVLHKNEPRDKKLLGVEQIDVLKEYGLTKLLLESNESALVAPIFDAQMCEKIEILEQIKFSSFRLERNRLYVQVPWLPDNFNKRDALLQIIQASIHLAQQIDKT
ncbi:hypothetical protein [Aureispira anguillae]|uniref:Uncharacterized protein n=1 Tax=Aureispira anguillae TaxID=2864201 RepID=A0A915YL84_9BACT|nr:hypothetical protein [Aureispira anguillae]BDS15290.1 hypothetical protein AsAng_0060740 [Aureispira anguillae]